MSDADAAHTAASAMARQLFYSLRFSLHDPSDDFNVWKILNCDAHEESDLYRPSNVSIFSSYDLARAFRRGGPYMGCAVSHDLVNNEQVNQAETVRNNIMTW